MSVPWTSAPFVKKRRGFSRIEWVGCFNATFVGWLVGPGWLSESESYLIEQLSTNFLLSPEKERDEYKCSIKNIEQKKRFRIENIKSSGINRVQHGHMDRETENDLVNKKLFFLLVKCFWLIVWNYMKSETRYWNDFCHQIWNWPGWFQAKWSHMETKLEVTNALQRLKTKIAALGEMFEFLYNLCT